MNVALISCGKAKRNVDCKAKDLYIGGFFIKNLKYAEKNYDKTYILSAKYGLLDLEDAVKPYDMTLNKMPLLARKLWSARVLAQINNTIDIEDKLFILAGNNYREYLLPLLKNDYEILFMGMGMGEKMKAMT